MVVFFFRNHTGAGEVLLAGSFTGWQNGALPMLRTDSGWIARVKLRPGKYWYKFIVNDNWTIDTDNLLSENDGRGNTNSAFFKPNVLFTLSRYDNARKVYLSGSFNNWRSSELPMIKTASGWQLPLYLSPGTYTYRFVADGKWMVDPANPDKFPNEFNDYNSVIRIGEPHLFSLNGYADARQVMLAGSFNNWHNYELPMHRTAGGWQLPYTLGGGNYEYGFIIDGKEIPDPANPLRVNNRSYLVVETNFTFRLKGYAGAGKVYLWGDFDDWSSNTLAMKREGDEWVCSVHLSAGKHFYKFIIDGKWIIDPANPLWEQNQQGTGNSIVWVD
jgi:1,4-alpha-glucan branching enzyme